jgi:hypothetical protein
MASYLGPTSERCHGNPSNDDPSNDNPSADNPSIAVVPSELVHIHTEFAVFGYPCG